MLGGIETSANGGKNWAEKSRASDEVFHAWVTDHSVMYCVCSTMCECSQSHTQPLQVNITTQQVSASTVCNDERVLWVAGS